jgi:hypothetical protein
MDITNEIQKNQHLNLEAASLSIVGPLTAWLAMVDCAVVARSFHQTVSSPPRWPYKPRSPPQYPTCSPE